jgi:Glu-tRNA(Gln) amidotransferase subunit E-like FAD-binding protein
LFNTSCFNRENEIRTPVLLLQTSTEVAHSIAAAATKTAVAAAEAVAIAVAIAMAIRSSKTHKVNMMLRQVLPGKSLSGMPR